MAKKLKRKDAPQNLILFGPSGTGKSHFLEFVLPKEVGVEEDDVKRVTFHPEYSHFEFFGQYKPSVVHQLSAGSFAYPGTSTSMPQFLEMNITKQVLKGERQNFLSAGKSLIYTSNELTRIARESARLTRAKRQDNIESSKCKIQIRDGAHVFQVPVYLQRPPNEVIRVRVQDDPNFLEMLRAEFKSHSGQKKCLRFIKTSEKQFEVLRGELHPNERIETRKPLVYYSFVPGPFLELLVKAKQNPSREFALIVEEINRGNCAAIFGDILQLLDRNEDGSSRFPVTPTAEVAAFLAQNQLEPSLSLPGNLHLWATMNISDQSLQALDVAFKRRWHMRYVGPNEFKAKKVKLPRPYSKIEWKDFLEALNRRIASHISEDYILGPFFFAEQPSAEEFVGKLLSHLWFDVARHERTVLFAAGSKTYEQLIKKFLAGEDIFTPDLFSTSDEVDEKAA